MMKGTNEQLARLARRSRKTVSAAGLPSQFASLTLRDATLLVPRSRAGAHRVTLHDRDMHVIGRTYARHEMLARCGGTWFPMRTTPGAVTVIPAGLEITCHIPDAHDCSLVILPDSRLQASAAELGYSHRVGLAERFAEDDAATSGILDVINQELNESEAASTLLIERAIDLLCLQLIRAHRPVKHKPARGGLAPWQVKRVTSYMCDQLDRDITLDKLAELVGLSRFHFCTAFREATGRTPHEWLIGRRIGRARELLADQKMRIADVGLAVGYATPSAFSASFRKLVGVTPSRYRRRQSRT